LNTSEFYLSGQEVSPQPYQYRACGLDNIYLLNGFTIAHFDGEEAVAVQDVDGLHRAIGRHIVMHRKGLAPKEVRFLRKTLDLTQAELAQRMGYDSQSVARWEKGTCNMPGAAEKLLRAHFLAHNLANDDELPLLRKLLMSALQDLDELDEWEPDQAQFQFGNRWEEKYKLAA
jgi:DNA-binding transcriptional regulator YiaG